MADLSPRSLAAQGYKNGKLSATSPNPLRLCCRVTGPLGDEIFAAEKFNRSVLFIRRTVLIEEYEIQRSLEQYALP